MIPHIKGITTPQAHVGIPDGLCEEEYARSGFFGRYAHLYRSEEPVNWVEIEGPLRPEAFDLRSYDAAAAGDFIQQRQNALLANREVSLQYLRLRDAPDYYFRNADSDDVFFVHKGHGRIETDFGPLDYESGDYLVVPRGTVYRLDPKIPSDFLVIESFSEIRLPDKGMLGQHAIFDPAVIKVPTPEPQSFQKSKVESGDPCKLKIKRLSQITTVTYPRSPITTVGWKGTLSVWQINIRDIRPISCDRYHLPPSAHTTFVADGFVICTFLPRPLEVGDPKAMRVPFYHSNIDYDEVLFYHDGEFFSRANIDCGMMTFHPQGIHHGPQKAAVDRTAKVTHTNEVAVMIDTRNPLMVAPGSNPYRVADYWKSWGAP